jgi:hypothetical protein
LANRELDILRDALREHVNALAVDIGPRTPLNGDSLVRAANYIHSVSRGGLSVREQHYQYYDQRVTNVLASPTAAGALPITLSALITTLSCTWVQMTMRALSRSCWN